MKAMSDKMILDVRARLNVQVEVTEGSKPAASPIESFEDMVRWTPLPCE